MRRHWFMANLLAVRLPRQMVYFFEEYKFESAFVGIMAVCATLLPLFHLASDLNSVQALHDAAPPYQETIHVTGPNYLPRTSMVTASPIAPITGDAIWPIHGRVTTLFGTPHAPYQDSHTGMDISSAKPSGITPVLAYRSGTVTEVVRSWKSYGNYVVVDHGGGLSSLYGHLSRMSVSVGQSVGIGAVLGYEGSTGVSTGTHLHFEIRQDGKPVNPRKYVPGGP